MLPWDLQRPPRSVPNPSKIEPGAAPDVQKQTQSNDKRSQTRKKRPQERKMSQHGPNMPPARPGLWRLPPPRKEKQYVNASKNAMGFNTPGAASSAADLKAQEAPKSRPKPSKINTRKSVVFAVDFVVVPASFRKGFRTHFERKNR